MFNLKIDKQYSIPDAWNEISFGKVLDIAELFDRECPEPYKEMLLKGESPDEIDPSDTMHYVEFQVKYLALLLGCDESVIRNIRPSNGVDINWLFERTCKFIGYPFEEDCTCNEFIEVQGKRYYRVKEAVDSFGRTTNLEDSDWATYATGMVISSVIDKTKKGNLKVNDLVVLTAVMFRPRFKKAKKWFDFNSEDEFELERYDEKTVQQRTRLFKEAPASEVFGAYFFLLREQAKSIQSLQSSLSQAVKEAQESRLLKLRLIMIYLKWFFIGLWSGIVSRRKGSLRNKVKALWNAL